MVTVSKDPLRLRDERQPDRLLPVLYFAFAHLCLLAAMAVLALAPQQVAGFFYHPRMLAVVHLVTLGWISGSILGALYALAPMALATALPAGKLDFWAFGAFALGATGMASHFWIEEPSGMAWSGGLALAAILWVGVRLLRALAGAKVQPEVKLHFHLAFLNVALAALLGLAIGMDKVYHFWPGYVLDRVYAHLHLAALGWATMMVMAAGYRLLPMLLPAAMPRGGWVWAGGVVLEAGVLTLAAGYLAGSHPAVVAGGLLAATGIGLFFGRVIWMRAHPRPAPKDLPRPDLPVGHVASALVCLGLAVVLGLALLLGPEGAWKLRAAMAYGVLGLVGFLGQMVVGVAGRLVPLYAYFRALSAAGFERSPPPPHSLPSRGVQAAILALWTAGLPPLALGLAFDLLPAVRVAAWLLLAAVALEAVHQGAVLRRAQGSAVSR